MDDQDSEDMLDCMSSSSQQEEQVSEVSDNEWASDDEEVISMSSSPMSLGEDDIDDEWSPFWSADGESTSHLLEDDEQFQDDEQFPSFAPAELVRPASGEQVVDLSIIPGEASVTRDHVLVQIESIFEQIADAILAEKDKLSITLTNAHRSSASDRTQPRWSQKTITFPGKTPKEAWRFSQ